MSKRRSNKESLKLQLIGDLDNEVGARQYSCCNVSHSCLRWTIGVLAVLAAFSIVGVVFASFFTSEDVIANQRYFIRGPSINAIGFVTGQLQLNTNSRQIVWDLITVNMSVPLSSLSIHGPITFDQPTAPPYVNICGAPTTLVCTYSGFIQQTNPDGLSLQQFINTIRDRPFAYYLNVSTVTYMAGDAYAQLGISSGH
jgi:hypothetical protein